MQWCLHEQRRDQRGDHLSRFDPRYWTVDFPRPMMAAVVASGADSLRVDTVFYRTDDLAGLIWESADRHDHPLLRYDTVRDYRDCRLRFRWRSGGIKPLDARHGPTLTIEGRDASGKARAWYVRLWNYATGTAEDAEVAIDFANLAGGFRFPEERDPVWAGDVDRMFVSLVAPDYDAGAAFLARPQEGWVELTGISCDGPGAVIGVGAAVLPEQGFRIASGYDDSYHLTPQRLLRNMLHLGYRGDLVHYVGMSHYFRLERSGDGLYASLAGGVLNAPCAAWHRGFAVEARALGYDPIWSLSYELFDAHCWGDWKQRSADGAPALTGWSPPSTLLSPAHGGAMAYLQAVARAFLAIGQAAGLPPKFQVGEPWWWVRPADGAPCLYDAAAVAAFAPVPMASMAEARSQAQRDTLDRAGACLAASTAALCAAAKAAAPGCVTHLLTYLPTVLDPAAPEAVRANMPVGWASPAFDILQLEDYDWVTAGDTASTRKGVALAEARLGYPPERQHYFSGFVLRADQRAQWGRIAEAAGVARARGIAATFVWAMPQVMRDGFVCWEGGEDRVQAFDDVLFPLALGREAEVTPGFSTAILTSAGGREARNAAWAEARTTYDVGPGLRSAEDMATLLSFFRARLGPARGFRLRDPFDSSATDEAIGTGDGTTRRFALVRHYGDQPRRITRPVAGSVSVRVAGRGVTGFVVEPGGWLLFDTAPVAGAAIAASFAFDVPVRFAEDRLSVTLAGFRAGAAASVPLVEVREA
ncbi:TIGR02217 family protein [Sphingomonas sp. NCPPB 2930]|uniref:phage distal tail protein, Rcc01695 family n=1 Tax=Sphingomonas sp. NCPPB 2930 TaxID=3162788 RepID=UPI0036DE8CD1